MEHHMKHRFSGYLLGALTALCLSDVPLTQAQTILANDKTATPSYVTLVGRFDQAPSIAFDALDYARLAAEDNINDSKNGSMRFAIGRDIQVTQKNGVWSDEGSGKSAWRFKVFAPSAVHLNFGFSRISLPDDAELLILSGDGKSALGPYNKNDIPAHGQLWTAMLPGEGALLQITVPSAQRSQVDFTLSRVSQGYRGFGFNTHLCKAGACNMDVACLAPDDPWNGPRRSVGAYTVGGTDTCTGSLVNNSNNDRRMLFATARHCSVTTNALAQTTLVFWNYESPTCRTPGSAASGTVLPKPTTTSAGLALLAQTNNPFAGSDPAGTRSDWAILELVTPPVGNTLNLFWAGWDRRPPPTQCAATGGPNSTAGRCAGIHHPGVDEKRITFVQTPMILDNISGATGVHWQANWDVSPPILPGISPVPVSVVPGVTERGSSGSPLYDANQRLIGVLSGGPSACGATGVNLRDQYGGLFHAWEGNGTPATRMKDVLDPGNSGVDFIDGINACNAPATPAGITAVASAANTVTVGWGAVAGAESYKVFRANGACGTGTYSQIAAGVTGTSYVDTSVSGLQTYSYKVTAFDQDQPCDSLQSSCASATATGVCSLAPNFAGIASATTNNQAICSNTLAWSAAAAQCTGPVSYNVYRSTTAGFSPSAANRIGNGVTGSSFADNGPINFGVPYFYKVRSIDASNGSEDGNTIERSAAPGGPLTTSNIVETFEAVGGFDVPGWSTQALSGANNWTWSTAQSHTPTHAWASASLPSVSDRVLVSPSFGVVASTTLSFWHTFAFESATTCYDGGTLEISTDGGTTWTVLPDAAFTAGGFNGTVNNGFSNPIGGKRAWCNGTIGPMTQVSANLGAFAGQTAKLRWHAGDDSSTVVTGWFVDSVTINNAGTASSCLSFNPDAYFINGFE
jgi:lysyl endopeptidase